ncbi:MAG: HAD family hydrolase [Hyphomicrobiales bacterium]|nr:HAD family hydrolase [Hyphomicrobiales bacterium]
MKKPRAILFDLDDTILPAFARPDSAWAEVVDGFFAGRDAATRAKITQAIQIASRDFWADSERHKLWRVKIPEARRKVVASALGSLAQKDPRLTPDVAQALADRFTAFAEDSIAIFRDAHDVLAALRARGHKLALITNGASGPQRAKIERFDLAHRFDHVQIEGEAGFGKPEDRAYLHAMEKLGVAAHETWMVGDNLEWEVVGPQRLGIFAIWFDHRAKGLPAGCGVKPDMIVTSLTELLARTPG